MVSATKYQHLSVQISLVSLSERSESHNLLSYAWGLFVQIALEFGMRTTDVIDRIKGLEAMGRLTGVMDERGKVGAQ
jgi:hypothetical protein